MHFFLFNFSTGLEFALKCISNKNYEEIEEACKEELNKTDNSLIRRTLALNLLATFTILRGNYDTGAKHLTTVIETPNVPNKVKYFILFSACVSFKIVYYYLLLKNNTY